MSAFIVEDETINRVIGALKGFDRQSPIAKRLREELSLDLTTRQSRHELGTAMFALNCNAIEQRYGAGEAKEFRALDYSYRPTTATLVQAYKSLRCWLYQCSEGDVKETSLLYQTMSALTGDLAEEIVEKLPAYEKAEW
jgi:hypothetical protein